ncbi:inactive dipeptidyl peptidase 10-like isoform X2 [Nerophis lumbriciformis]|uniref:inactive dipeptidyl peptidase 10-like isoform X2 n=1 Tax=Nerophis lumbriciformis TaxID=546530 RepID=UPI002AE09C8C|nr:inactive dipeptidyl peptidase 10-like isoform X2 [Nerophis lumbriciformis]
MNQSAGAAQHSRRYSCDDKDMGQRGPDRNWKGIGIALLVIMLVLSLIGLSIVLLSKDNRNQFSGSHLTLDDIFHRNFQIHDPDAKWLNEKDVVFLNWDGHLLKANTENNKTELLLRNTTFSTFKASKFAVSPDLNLVLLGYDVSQVYQHSFLASYLIFNLNTREVIELNPPEVSNAVLQLASWGVSGQQLIYIFENNIYYQADMKSSSLRLTSSGQDGVIFNGIADWLYEEEVLHSQAAHWWSPDGSRLAYLTINDSLVPKMLLPSYLGSLYPRGQEYAYPKMAQINPSAKLYVVILNGSSQATEVLPPDSLHRSEYYITMVKWVTADKLAVRWVTRAQNMSILSLCNVITNTCAKGHVMMSDKWLDRQNQEPFFSKDHTVFFMALPLKHGLLGTFQHVTMISTQGQNVKLIPLTSGCWEVSQILAYDENTQSVFFLSKENSTTQQQLYSVLTAEPFYKRCLTCALFKSHCTYYDAELSTNYQHVLLHCRGPGIPQTTLHRLDNMEDHQALEMNAVLRQSLSNRKVPQREKRTVQINNFALSMELIVPVDFDETYEHPLLLMLDSAPGGQAVSDRFSLSWDSVLVSSDDVIVARLDGRGSGFQGQRVLHEVDKRLGTVDVQDQIAIVKHLMMLPYIDGNRVGVYGKAYGGFLTSILLLSYSSTFSCGVAVAPITNWRLHGSTITEKYFGFPAEDDHKYQVSSLLGDVTGPVLLKFLIIHGTADANVHFQHSAELIKHLSESNHNYTLQIFPDEGHVFASIKSQRYMLNSVVAFFKDCFDKEQTEDQNASKDDD